MASEINSVGQKKNYAHHRNIFHIYVTSVSEHILISPQTFSRSVYDGFTSNCMSFIVYPIYYRLWHSQFVWCGSVDVIGNDSIGSNYDKLPADMHRTDYD